jgi:hypothetical protein
MHLYNYSSNHLLNPRSNMALTNISSRSIVFPSQNIFQWQEPQISEEEEEEYQRYAYLINLTMY